MDRKGVATERSEKDRKVTVGDANDGGGEETFESLFRRYYPRLVQALCMITLDRETAADAAQEAFLQLHLDWDRVSHYENPVGWIYRVALNRSRDYGRRSRRLFELGQNQPWTTTDDAGIIWEPERGFFEALKRLPQRQRQAAALHYVAGLSQEETADVMGLSEGAVKSHLFRARETLRRNLEVES